MFDSPLPEFLSVIIHFDGASVADSAHNVIDRRRLRHLLWRSHQFTVSNHHFELI